MIFAMSARVQSTPGVGACVIYKAANYYYSAPLVARSIVINPSVCLSVCLSVREHISGTVGPMFVCSRVLCLFVCQHDNFRASKHRMMKLE